MSSPISNVDQMTGRVLRIKEGKEQPKIIDLVDICIPDISRTLFNRLNFYKKKDWKIQFIFISSDGKKRLLQEDEVINILKDH